jgi:release factor glutamine methyltransferase
MAIDTIISSAPLTIADCLALSSELKGVSDTARLDCEVLLASAIGKERVYLYTWPEKQLTKEQQRIFSRFFDRRLQGEPVAHITGEREFWSLSLSVNNSTLIPRPETELLVELALGFIPDNEQSLKIADLGTGTGAVAFAIAAEKPYCKIYAYEKYADAVALARSNQQRLALNNVDIIQSDWLQQAGDNKFDIIVSNPPYIDKTDLHLEQGDVRFEPRTALVAEDKGLQDISMIIEQAPNYLCDNGWLLLEHGYQQAEAIQRLLQQDFVEVFTKQDMSGLPRVTVGKYVNSKTYRQ